MFLQNSLLHVLVFQGVSRMPASSPPKAKSVVCLMECLKTKCEIPDITADQAEVVRELFETSSTGTPLGEIVSHLSTESTELLELETASYSLSVQRPDRDLHRGGEIILYWHQLQEVITHREAVARAIRQDG